MKTPQGMPSISAVLFYPDLAEAGLWLTRAFGFEERTDERVVDEAGAVVHAELDLGDGMIILSGVYPPFETPSADRPPSQALYVYVDAVDPHCDNARARGASITDEPRDTNYGDRVYSATDPAGHHWIFAEQRSAQGRQG